MKISDMADWGEGVRPNFMIVGAAKCGTSSLWAYLSEHPEVFFPECKEPNYFALAGASLPEPGPRSPEAMQELLYSDTITDFGEYAALFQGANGAKAVGEASVRYLYSGVAAERIQAALPDIRLIVMLRDPVQRLYSHYWMNRRYGLEPLSLMDAVEAEDRRKKAGWGYDWHYVSVGRYAEQLSRYLERFPREQIGVFLFEDFAKESVGIVQEVCRFLGVDGSFIPDVSSRKNAAVRPRNLALEAWLNPPGKEGAKRKAQRFAFLPGKLKRRMFAGIDYLNQAPVPKLKEDDRRHLREYFADDIAETARLLGKEMPW